MQERRNSSALAMELCPSYPSDTMLAIVLLGYFVQSPFPGVYWGVSMSSDGHDHQGSVYPVCI